MGLFSFLKKDENTAPQQHQQQGGGKPPSGRVRIDSKVYTLAGIDPKHILVDGLNKDFVDGQRVHFAFVLPTEDGDVDAPTQGTIVKINNGRAIIRFLGLQPYYQKIMRKVADKLPYVYDVTQL